MCEDDSFAPQPGPHAVAIAGDLLGPLDFVVSIDPLLSHAIASPNLILPQSGADSGLGGQADLDLSILHAHRVGGDVHRGRQAERLPGPQVESRTVARAFDLV